MTAPRLTIGSLFSGIGGLELGLECAGLGPTLFQVERDEFCRGVLAKHWPSAMRFDDVLAVGAHNLPRVDVLCGGFPCQDISVAGRRVGIHGERSGLWFEYVRIIRELRPRYVVVENVAALLVRGLDVVLGELAESGYDAEWDCVPASAIGAPHRRDRLFLLAYPISDTRGLQPERQPGVCDSSDARDDGAGRLPERASAQLTESGSVGETIPNATSPGLEGWQQPATAWPTQRIAACRRGWWTTEPDVGRVADGVPAWTHRLRALGNAVVPQVAEVVGQVILALEAERAA